MGRRRRILLGTVLAFAALAVISTIALMPRDRMFRGKPESVWLEEVAYWGDEKQTKLWLSFGPEGVDVLARGLETDNGTFKRAYRKAYRKYSYRLPRALHRLLPLPKDEGYATRMKAASLLRQLGTNAEPALPVLKRALRDQEGVRQIATSCFQPFLPKMAPAEKAALLPEFVRGIRDRDSGIRNNTAIALKYFPEHREVVVPELVNALKDPYLPVRILAAEALEAIDPEAGVKAGATSIICEILKHPDDQIAYRAAGYLGEVRREPQMAVPALAARLRSTNSLVASSCAYALARYGRQGTGAVPALLQVITNGPPNLRKTAQQTLKKIDPEAVAGVDVR